MGTLTLAAHSPALSRHSVLRVACGGTLVLRGYPLFQPSGPSLLLTRNLFCLSLSVIAGVPLSAPVAGIAMGLILEPDGSYVVLSDILGAEDALGDMDFKVCCMCVLRVWTGGIQTNHTYKPRRWCVCVCLCCVYVLRVCVLSVYVLA